VNKSGTTDIPACWPIVEERFEDDDEVDGCMTFHSDTTAWLDDLVDEEDDVR
jgi:hypothetical protein